MKKQKQEVDFWTKEEFEKVISLIYKEDFYQHFLFMSLWFLFIQVFELVKQQRFNGMTSILKQVSYLLIKHSITRIKAIIALLNRKPKQVSDTLCRILALVLLKTWKNVQQKVVKTGYIMSYNGIPTQKHTISYAIDRYAKKAGVHRIRIHGLRHSHASLLISMGENPLIIKDRLRHEDIETTLGTYGHLYPNSNFEVANKLNGIITFKQAEQNYDSSLKNQFTVNYLRKQKQKVQ